MNISLHPTPRARPAAPGNARHWVPVRKLHAGHRPRVLEHLLALDADDRVWRFGHHASDEHIERYVAQLDFERDGLLGIFDRRLSLLAFGHLAPERGGDSAEFAVSVLPRAGGRGLGRHLFDHAVRQARNRGMQMLYLQLARDNAPMMAIARGAGAAIDLAGADATAGLPLPGNTLGSRIEALIDQRAAELDFRIKRHAMRLARPAPAEGGTS